MMGVWCLGICMIGGGCSYWRGFGYVVGNVEVCWVEG